MSFHLKIPLFFAKYASLFGSVAVLFVSGNLLAVAEDAGKDSLTVVPVVQVFFKQWNSRFD